MKIDQKILNEIARYNYINRYINEQDVPPPPAAPPAPEGEVPPPPGGEAPPPPVGGEPAGAPTTGATAGPPAPVDLANDPDVEKIDDKKGETEEIEVTDLVKSQKSVETKQEEYFNQLFQHLENLESKLSEMDNVVNKLNSIEQKIEKYRNKTAEERLELRSLDSGPFNQKLSQYFDDKMPDLEKSGKNEYILTQDEVEDYSPMEIKKSFKSFGEEPTEDNFKRIT